MEIWAGTQEGLVVLGGQPRVALEGLDVNCLVGADRRVLALADGRSIWEIGRDGVEEVTRHLDLRLNCLLSNGGDVLIGAAHARLLRLTDGELHALAAFDAAEDRDDWYTPWGGPPDVRSLTRTGSGGLFANVHVGGILRSDDDGARWSQTIDIHSDVHEVIAMEPTASEALLAATAWGLAASLDGGKEWTFSDEGLHASYCRAVAVGDGTVFLSVSVGPFGGRAAIYRRDLNGSTFEKCEKGLPEWFPENIDTGCLSAAGSTAVFGTADGSVFISDDFGATWEPAADDLAPVRWIALVE